MTSRIKNFLAGLSDLESAKQHITDDCHFIAVRSETYDAMPLYGTFRGLNGLQAFVSGLRAHFDTQSFAVDHVIETETLGAAFGRFEHLVKPTGAMFRSHWGLLCSFKGGKNFLLSFL